MTRLVVDNTLGAKLDSFDQSVELCDASGRTLGYFYPAPVPGSVKSPISDEEIARREQQPEGSSLAEILQRLQDL